MLNLSLNGVFVGHLSALLASCYNCDKSQGVVDELDKALATPSCHPLNGDSDVPWSWKATYIHDLDPTALSLVYPRLLVS
jgi:hypothetical protein